MARLKSAFASVTLLFWGVVKRVYLWAPSILLDPLDYYERYFKPLLAPWGQEVNMPSYLFPYILGLGLIVAAILTFHELRKRLEQLEEREKPRLEIVFDPLDPSCRMESWGAGEPGILRVFRVGIKNLSNLTITNVRVMLDDLSPQGIPFRPIPLHLMHDNPAPNQSYQTSFGLNPGLVPTRYIGVVEETRGCIYGDLIDPLIEITESRTIALCYAVRNVPNTIRAGHHELTILAEGQDCPPCRRVFVVDVDNEGNLQFGPKS